MELRPRDGNGRAITSSKDGLIRSFKKIIDRDQLDPMPEVPVRGGEMYYFKTASGAGPKGENVVKMVKYDPTVAKEKRIPKFKDNYTKVKNAIGTIADASALTDAEVKRLATVKKLYVDTLGVVTQAQFTKIMKELKIIEPVNDEESGDNTTDHADLKNFVLDAIKTYRDVHKNRAVGLDRVDYKKFINKVLMRVRDQYYKEVSPIVVDASASGESIYTHYTAAKIFAAKGNAPFANALTALGTVTSGKYANAEKLNTELNKTNIIKDSLLTNTTKLTTHSPADISGSGYATNTLQIFHPLTPRDDDLQDLKTLIEELYNIFIQQTEQLVKKEPVVGFEFQDGGKNKRVVGSRGRKGSQAKPKSKAAEAKAKAKALAKAHGSRRR